MTRWLLFFYLISSAAFAQHVIEGRILDKETGKPVPFASVGVVGTARGTSSNLEGQFSIVVPGVVTLRVTCIGYESVEIINPAELHLIQLKPATTQLSEVVILSKRVNPRQIVRRAFGSIASNFDTQPFLQNFFYRHYCKDDHVYGRLIEASVDIWKHNGYRSVQRRAGEKEEMRVTNLRRSLDKTAVAQGHVPIAVGSIIEADVAAYQAAEETEHLNFFNDVSNLRVDSEDYEFTFEGITNYDGHEVYRIDYQYKDDSALTNAGNFIAMPRARGSLYITTDTFAFVKTEDVKYHQNDTVKTLVYYRKLNERFYPYHLIRDGKHHATDKSVHWFRIELMSVEVRHGSEHKFFGTEPGKAELLNIPYDSVYWGNHTVLKTTPLEDTIIRDLGGGKSLNHQFYLYQQYERNLMDGGKNGEEKFKWLVENSKGKRILYVGFWGSECRPYLNELEQAKRLNRLYKGQITFVLLSLENDEAKWQQALEKYNLFTDGIVHYRIGDQSEIARLYQLREIPSYVLLTRDGARVHEFARHPGDAGLEEELRSLIAE